MNRVLDSDCRSVSGGSEPTGDDQEGPEGHNDSPAPKFSVSTQDTSDEDFRGVGGEFSSYKTLSPVLSYDSRKLKR